MLDIVGRTLPFLLINRLKSWSDKPKLCHVTKESGNIL